MSRAGRQQGFSVLEVLVVVAVVGILAAIAIPNFMEALGRTKMRAAYVSIRQVDGAINKYMIEYDEPPFTVDPQTLEPLVSSQSLSPEQRTAILATMRDQRIEWYFGWASFWGGYDYILSFRPKADRDATAWCYLFPEGIWRWDTENGWHQPI